MKKTEKKDMSRVKRNTKEVEISKQDNNHSTYYWIAIMILIIIIIILLFLNRCRKIENESLVPTGNVDVFNIDFDCDCNGDNNKCNNNDKPHLPSWNDFDEDKNELGNVYVNDKNGNYLYLQRLKIFENPYYEFTTKIAPGVSNSYKFEVHNNSNANINYYFEMIKKCNYDVKLQYRLKKNGKYILGDEDNWVSDKDLKTTASKLNSKNNDKYVLDWKWEYEDGRDEIDTYIGENMKDTYKLNIKFYFEQN